MLLTAQQYFESRRKHHARHCEGEHAWFGDCSVSLPELSCYAPHAVPWYVAGAMDCAHDTDHHVVQHAAPDTHAHVACNSAT